MELKPFDIVKASDGFKSVRRPFVLAATSQREPITRLLALATSKKWMRKAPPGWIEFSTIDSGGDKDAFLLPTCIVARADPAIEKIKPLRRELKTEFIDILAASIRPCEPVPRQLPPGFLRRLGPPHYRWSVTAGFAQVLRANCWKPPRQGDIIHLPPWWGDSHRSKLLLVVSNTTFNQRYCYPEVLAVPLVPAAAIDGEQRAACAVFAVPSVSNEPYCAIHEWLMTFSFVFDLFRKCEGRGCPPDSTYRLRLPDELGGRCIMCEGEVASWPSYVTQSTTEHAEALGTTLRKLFAHLGIGTL
jgi:hypothetical protein